MEVQFTLNGKKVSTEIAADTVLLNLLRDLGCKSVNCTSILFLLRIIFI